MLFHLPVVEQQAQPCHGIDLEMKAALVAEPLVFFEALAPNHLATAFAL